MSSESPVSSESAGVSLIINRIDGRRAVELVHAEKVAALLFSFDPSSASPQSYDAWVIGGARRQPNRFTADDLRAMNRTMAARSPHRAWEELLDRDLPWLAALSLDWDLVLMPDDEWVKAEPVVWDALTAVIGPYRNLSVATKMLHLKRPFLIPVCDSFVQDLLFGKVPSQVDIAGAAAVGRTLVRHVRGEARRNLGGLVAIQRYLSSLGIDRSLVRILDLLLWASHPQAMWHRLPQLVASWFSDPGRD